MLAAAGPTLLGTACANPAEAASKSPAIARLKRPKIGRASLMGLLLFLRRRSSNRRQTFFRNNFHGVLHGNLGNAAALVDPGELFVGFGVGFDFIAQVRLRIVAVTRNPLKVGLAAVGFGVSVGLQLAVR